MSNQNNNEDLIKEKLENVIFIEDNVWDSDYLSIVKYKVDDIEPYWIKVKYKVDNVVVIPYIIDSNNKVITKIGVLNEFNPSRKGNFDLTLVTGSKESIDETVLDTAIREFEEETGHSIKNCEKWSYLGKLTTSKLIQCEHDCFSVDITDSIAKKIPSDKMEALSKFKVISLNEAIQTNDAFILSLITKLFISKNFNAFEVEQI